MKICSNTHSHWSDARITHGVDFGLIVHYIENTKGSKAIKTHTHWALYSLRSSSSLFGVEFEQELELEEEHTGIG